MRVGELLRSCRVGAGLSLRATSRAAGIDPGALSRYERGHKTPRSDTVEHILNSVGFELDARPKRSASARFLDSLCEYQANAILEDPTLVTCARSELARLEGRSSSLDVWRILLDAGPVACAAVLTASTDAAHGLKADSPFAFVVDLSDSERRRLLELAYAA